MCKVPHFGTQVQVKVLSEKSTQVQVKVLFSERIASKSKSTFKSTWVLFQVLLLVHFRVVSKLFEGTEGYKQFIAKKNANSEFQRSFFKEILKFIPIFQLLTSSTKI